MVALQKLLATLLLLPAYDRCDFLFFTVDTEAERNALKEHVYPKLRDFCRENYGIEFQVIKVFSSSSSFAVVCGTERQAAF